MLKRSASIKPDPWTKSFREESWAECRGSSLDPWSSAGHPVIHSQLVCAPDIFFEVFNLIPLDQFVVFDSVRHGESRMEGLGALPKGPSLESKSDPRKAFFWPGTLLECSYHEPPSNQDQVVCGLPCFIR